MTDEVQETKITTMECDIKEIKKDIKDMPDLIVKKVNESTDLKLELIESKFDNKLSEIEKKYQAKLIGLLIAIIGEGVVMLISYLKG